MTLPVASFLVENVFCILDDPEDDFPRIGAREFGLWVRALPALMAPSRPKTHTHFHVSPTVSVSTSHSLALALALYHTSVHPPLTHNTPMDAVLDRDYHDGWVFPPLDLVPEASENEEWQQEPRRQVEPHDLDVARSPSPSELSNTKYGAKGKHTTPSADLVASRGLVRKRSRQTRSARAPIQSSGSPASGSHALDIEPIFQTPYDPVFVDRSGSLASASRTLAREVSSLTRSTITIRTNQWKLEFGKGSNVATRITRSDGRHLQIRSGSARPISVPNMITELGSPPRLPKQRRQLSNYLRTSKDKFSVPRPVLSVKIPDDDTDMRNDSGDENCEDEFFDVDSGSYNGPGSTKTVSS